jgi:hypothetical protein
MRRHCIFVAAFAAIVSAAGAAGAASDEPALVERGMSLFSRDPGERGEAIDFFVERGKPDAAAALILALRFTGEPRTVAALHALTGEAGRASWGDWMLWQEVHPEIAPFDGFDAVHARMHYRIDPDFRLFLRAGNPHDIRIEEVVWGGVRKDGIPALTNPRLVAAGEAGYLNDDDLVFGVAINGDARAYPLRILDWHEMFNDVIGGVPVSLAYCTLCGSGILYETTVADYPQPLVFGSSGFLYRSNKLMYDTYTHSLWNQFTGRPAVGPLTGSGIELRTRPVVIARWADWKGDHPDTRVLDVDTGYSRDYAPGAAYADYFGSPDLMFPTNVDQSALRQKDYVFALRGAPMEKAWPLKLFEGGAVVNDTAGVLSLVLVGNAATRTVRAYRSDGLLFEKSDDDGVLTADGEAWRVGEDALVGPGGRTLPRLPGHIAYWFAWSGYFGATGEVATE